MGKLTPPKLVLGVFDHLDDAGLNIAQQYQARIGMVNTQYVIAKHIDRDHLHMHIIANRVDNKGHSIAEGWLGLRAKKVAQELTREHRLTLNCLVQAA